MRISEAFPSNYLKASDLQDRTIQVRMSHVEMEKIGDDTKPVLFFVGKERGLVLNKTNSKTIVSAYGDDTDKWSDKPLILFPAMVDFRGESVIAIRVRVPQTRAASAPAAPVQPEPPPVDSIPDQSFDDEIPF